MTLQDVKGKVAFYGAAAVKKQFEIEYEFCKGKMLENDVSIDSVESLPDAQRNESDRLVIAELRKASESFLLRMDNAKKHQAMVPEAEKLIEAEAIAEKVKTA